MFAPKDGKPKVKADADILLEHDAEDHSLDVVRNCYFEFLNLDKAGTTFTNAYTSDDIDPSNAMRIPWVEHWRERLRKRTLRPIAVDGHGRGEPNADDHGEGEDGVHHLDAQPFGLARAAAAVRRGAACSAAGVGWATVH